MTIKEIWKNKPDGATHYFEYTNKIYYLKYVDNTWMVWFDYDVYSEWGIANQTAINNDINKLKPL